MRVCYVSSSEGQNVHDLRLLREYQRRGYELSIFSMARNPLNLEGVETINYPIDFSTNSLTLKGGLRLVPKMLQAASELRREAQSVDILHAGFVQKDGLVGYLSKKRPLVLLTWGSDILIHPFSSRLVMALTRVILAKADAITVDADYVRQKLLEICPTAASKAFIFRHGVNLTLFKPLPPLEREELRERLGVADKKVLIMARMFESVYDHETFIKSLPAVIEQHPDTHIFLCGAGSLMPEAISHVQRLGLEQHITFTGLLTPGQLAPYFAASDLYVSTSKSDGSSLALMEAMACGLPAILTNVPANLEWVRAGEGGEIVPVGDSHVLSHLTSNLLEDERRIREYGKRNRQVAEEKADWSKNFDGLEQMLRGLVNT